MSQVDQYYGPIDRDDAPRYSERRVRELVQHAVNAQRVRRIVMEDGAGGGRELQIVRVENYGDGVGVVVR